MKLKYVVLLILLGSVSVFAQLNLPRESQRAEIAQIIGDARVAVVYHRPNVKNRKIWGELVPFGKVWRTGANEATTIEISRDATVNGQPLAAGKYSLHTIPGEKDWTFIFNKRAEQWGSFDYDEKLDALRVTAKPIAADFSETMTLAFENITENTAQLVVRWEKLAVPVTIDVGDTRGRTLVQIREQLKSVKSDDARTPQQAANWVLTMKMADSYAEALEWIEKSIKTGENFGNLNVKARLLAASGKRDEAIAAGEKAVALGKAATPPVNTSDLEKSLAEWKAGK